MPYEPRTIAFLCELFHAPQALDVAPLQRVHNSMFESGAPVGFFEAGFLPNRWRIELADGSTLPLSAMRVDTYLCPAEIRDETRFSSGLPVHYPLRSGLRC